MFTALFALLLSLQDGLSKEEFEKLHRELQPPKDGFWSIPWKFSLMEARELAVRENKPLYVLAPVGHPMAAS